MSTPTDQFDSPGTVPADLATAVMMPPPVPSSRDRCAACGAMLAPDQRYCVECGQRSGRARVPFVEELGRRGSAEPSAPRPVRRPRPSVNNTLIAGIGTLLLAMGIGVLIGRSGTRSGSPSVQVVTVPGAAGVAGAPASGTTTPSSTAAGSAKAGSSGGHTTAGGGSGSGSSKTSKKYTPPAKVVTVGSPGKGPGYQHGHFTGNFFGG